MTVRVRRPLDKPSLVDALATSRRSGLARYRDKCYGSEDLAGFVLYEAATLLFANLSGATGYLLRKLAYARLFRRFGRGVIIGKGVAVRHPHRIAIGHRVAIDDNVMLDASGAGDGGLVIDDEVIISRNCIVQGKLAPIVIGSKADIGPGCTISSISGVYIGQSVLIGAHCYLGGARYVSDRLDVPMMEQGAYT
jgi:acetyltransferase-like isoleucine patch superfamily enzyme